MKALRIWLAVTALWLVAMAIWTFVPPLVFVVLLTAALGVLAFVMIALARLLQAWREGR